jgi:hypothetical protein
MPFRVGVEEMVRVWGVLIDTPLHQPHAEHASVEVEILLRVARDGGDVVQTGDVGHEPGSALGCDRLMCKPYVWRTLP